ncbi:MAG: bacteriorhodopsin [Nitriliruptoraceae bacterium]
MLWNLENVVEFTPAQFDLISTVLTIGYAAHFAGLAYFILTRRNVAPRYRSMTTMSVVVMLSAALLLLRLDISLNQAFVFESEVGLYVLGEATYNHGFRYFNWLIDVPLLLTQSLFVLNIAKPDILGYRLKLGGAGALMVLLGYVGQFYEVADPLGALIWWGIAATIPFIYFTAIFWRLTGESLSYLPGQARSTMRSIRYLFLFSWNLYIVAYIVPMLGDFGQSAAGAVTRTYIFTIADVLSKIVYGILLGKVATARSVAEGFEVDGYEHLADEELAEEELPARA